MPQCDTTRFVARIHSATTVGVMAVVRTMVTVLLLLAFTAPGAKESRGSTASETEAPETEASETKASETTKSRDSATPGRVGPGIGGRFVFRLPALEGGQLSHADFPGRVLLLDFWATWCVACRAQKAVLEQVAAGFPEGSVQVLAVNVGEDDVLVHAAVADEPSPFPIVLDCDASFFTSLGLTGLPSLLMLDGEGRLVERATGLIDAHMLREMIRKVGLERAAARAEHDDPAEGESP